MGEEEFQRSADRRSGERRFPCCLPISLARGSSGPFLQDSCFYSSWGGPSSKILILQQVLHFTVPPTPSTHVLCVFLSRPPTPGGTFQYGFNFRL